MEDLVTPSAIRIALLGGTSPLGSDLSEFGSRRGHLTTVFSRTPGLDQATYADFDARNFDLVLNLIGGHQGSLSKDKREAIVDFDTKMLKACDAELVPYVHLSSGAVFGPLAEPATRHTLSAGTGVLSDYGSLKVDLESNHQQEREKGVQVSDLRLFSFAAPIFLREANYFLASALRATKSQNVMEVDATSFLRDFVGPAEVFMALQSILEAGTHGTFNLFSSRPVTKLEILESLSQAFGLQVRQVESDSAKHEVYCAEEDSALRGYAPRSSLAAVLSAFQEALSEGSSEEKRRF